MQLLILYDSQLHSGLSRLPDSKSATFLQEVRSYLQECGLKVGIDYDISEFRLDSHHNVISLIICPSLEDQGHDRVEYVRSVFVGITLKFDDVIDDTDSDGKSLMHLLRGRRG